jgi:uncharacterized membrane protein YdfJ with MMPL/SSD domain
VTEDGSIDMPRVMQRMGGALTSRRAAGAALALWLALAASLAPFAGKLESIENDEIVNYLPQAAPSTRVERLLARFPEGQMTTAVVVYARPGGLERRA